MLRLNPSQIQLEKRDLDWHVARHKQRQTVSREVDSFTETSLHSKSSVGIQSKKRTPRDALHRTVATTILASIDTHNDQALTLAQPVPRASKAFWDHVLARAGTPPTVPPPTPVDTSRLSSDKETIRSLPLEQKIFRSAPLHRVKGSSKETMSALRPDFEADIARETARPSTFDSGSSSSATLSDHDSASRLLQSPPDASSHAMMSRLTNFFQRKVKIDEDLEVEDQLSSHGLDGHVDPDAASECLGSLHSPSYGTQTDLRDLPMALKTYSGMSPSHCPVNEEYHRHRPQTNVSFLHEPQDFSQNEVHHPQDLDLRVSSEAAYAVRANYRDASFEATASQATALYDFGIPSRRRQITYRPRSKSYSFAASENSAGSLRVVQADRDRLYDEELPSDSPNDMLYSDPSVQMTDMTPSYDLLAVDHEPASSSPPIYGSDVTDSHVSQRQSHRYSGHGRDEAIDFSTSSSHHDMEFATSSSEPPAAIHQYQASRLCGQTVHSYSSPNWKSLVTSPNPSSSSRTPSAQIRLPPPFSTTPRLFSHNSPPPASPPVSSSKSIAPTQSPCTPSPQVSVRSHYRSPRPSSPKDLSSISPAPKSPFTVYNDQNPPHTQPQTPYDVDSAHQRLLRRYPGGSVQNATYTAPAQLSRISSTAVLPHVQSPRTRVSLMTPTRGPRGSRAARQEAENTDAITEEEREWRRLWNGEMGMRRGEREGV